MLLTRVPADRVGVSVRDPRKAQAFADRGVRVRQGGFTDAPGLAHAFEGASQVLIVSVDKLGEEAVRQHRAAIDGAVAAGARRILYTSHMGAGASSHTFDQLAGIATDVTGRSITRITAPDDRFREQLAGRGVPAEAADQLLGMFAASRAGEFSVVDPTLASLVGREPIGMGTVLREQLAGN